MEDEDKNNGKDRIRNEGQNRASGNKFELIKKSKPKLKIEDLFYYKINGYVYVGVIIQNQKYMNNREINGEINGCLFLESSYKSIDEISIDTVKDDILKQKLLLPPTNTNKKGWTNGFFVVFNNLDLGFANNVLQEIRFIYSEYLIYDINYSEVNDVPNGKLVGEVGIYADGGVETQLQMSLDLDFDAETPEWYNPYEYYEDLKEIFPTLEFPFWYYKAKKRLNK